MNKHFCCGSYEQHGKDLGSLVDQKQAAYGARPATPRRTIT